MRIRKSAAAGLAGSLAAISIVAALGWLESATAAPAEPSALTISWYTLDAGGTQTAAGGTLTLTGTAGQPDAGRMNSGAYTLWSGFWGGTLPSNALPSTLLDLPAIFRAP